MLQSWRSDGYGRNKLEVWAIGLQDEPVEIEAFAAGSSTPCLVDDMDPELSAFAKFGAQRDYLFVVDAKRSIRYRTDLAYAPLTIELYRDDLERVVLTLVESLP